MRRMWRRDNSVVPFLPLFEVERDLTMILAEKGHLSRFYPFYSRLTNCSV